MYCLGSFQLPSLARDVPGGVTEQGVVEAILGDLLMQKMGREPCDATI